MPAALLDADFGASTRAQAGGASALAANPGSANPGSANPRGAYLRSEDGGLLLDVCCGFGDILLGHADPRVDAAAHARWKAGARGVARLEQALGEAIAALIPCARAVRFTNDASRALVCAAAAARRATGRETVLVAGPGERRAGLGVAACERLAAAAAEGRSQVLRFGDGSALEQAMTACAEPPAAVVLAVTDRISADPGFMRTARRLADRCGAVLILDQVQTGLRLGPGGAEAMLGAPADLTVLGASLANGYPIAALAGRPALVEAAAPLTPASPVSLAAACAVLERLERDDVANLLRIRGAELEAELEGLLERTGARSFVRVCGDPTYSFLGFSPYKGLSAAGLQQLFRKESLARGVFTLGAHVMSHAHGDEEISVLLSAYAEVFPAMMERLDEERYDALSPMPAPHGLAA